ncbi:hypothetical protein [Arthrobacter sp. 260]|uniref:hypothetical protein n=1 Tax=Arthrobacter sp. 260 TaxID=2735314 RepID=UPI00149323D4|nr:hypothetical protein [Arthrobacter sp. 260]NOJ59763.1 hypothetical protein [Arthrobacter sp. 260]
MAVSAAERSTLTRLLGGAVYEQRGPRGRRQWSVDIGTATPQEIAMLGALVDGFYGPPPWVFVGPMQMVTNLLSPEQALLDTGTYSTGTTITQGGAGTTADGLRYGRSLNVSGGAEVALHRRDSQTERLPVVPGIPVTASIYGSGGAAIRLDWISNTGGFISNVTSAAGSGSWTRRVLKATPPSNAAGAQMVVVGATGFTMPAFTWTTDTAPWSPGKGSNAVTVDGLAEAVQMAVQDAPNMRRGSASFTIQELN